mmetsp:Transcript_61286/g.145939  ORF Transcript_61286/g.145939 Transcript_61286/m.145939 type:complete len:226 (+) Transcript_61286:1363-2040(+)
MGLAPQSSSSRLGPLSTATAAHAPPPRQLSTEISETLLAPASPSTPSCSLVVVRLMRIGRSERVERYVRAESAWPTASLLTRSWSVTSAAESREAVYDVRVTWSTPRDTGPSSPTTSSKSQSYTAAPRVALDTKRREMVGSCVNDARMPDAIRSAAELWIRCARSGMAIPRSRTLAMSVVASNSPNWDVMRFHCRIAERGWRCCARHLRANAAVLRVQRACARKR